MGTSKMVAVLKLLGRHIHLVGPATLTAARYSVCDMTVQKNTRRAVCPSRLAKYTVFGGTQALFFAHYYVKVAPAYVAAGAGQVALRTAQCVAFEATVLIPFVYFPLFYFVQTLQDKELSKYPVSV